jgi:hypothetical protein
MIIICDVEDCQNNVDRECTEQVIEVDENGECLNKEE